MNVLLVCALIVLLVYALVKKISLLAILLYYAERGIELPGDGAMRRYTLKAVKKIFHMPS